MEDDFKKPSIGNVSRISRHPFWDLLTKIATPAALIVSAASYLTGFVYRTVLFGAFGFDANVLDISVQNTIALGYAPFAIGLIVISLLYPLGLLLAKIMDNTLNIIHKKNGERRLDRFTLFLVRIYKPIVLANLYNAAALAMFCAVAAGFLQGLLMANNYISILNGGCKNYCVRVVTTRGKLDGIIIAQSKDTSLIVSRRAAYLLPNSTILSVAPSRKIGWVRLR